MPDLYEALAEIKSGHTIPKVWVDKIKALIDEALTAAPDDKKLLLNSVQQAFVPSNVLSAIA